MKCSECKYKYIVHPKYGNIENSKFVICSFKPKLRNHSNSEPKWCPIKKNVIRRVIKMNKSGECRPRDNGTIYMQSTVQMIVVGLHVNQKWKYTICDIADNLTVLDVEYKNILMRMTENEFNKWFKIK